MDVTIPVCSPSPRVREGWVVVTIMVFPWASVVVTVSTGGGPVVVAGGGTGGYVTVGVGRGGKLEVLPPVLDTAPLETGPVVAVSVVMIVVVIYVLVMYVVGAFWMLTVSPLPKMLTICDADSMNWL